jgi:hypothetical protein
MRIHFNKVSLTHVAFLNLIYNFHLKNKAERQFSSLSLSSEVLILTTMQKSKQSAYLELSHSELGKLTLTPLELLD